MNVADFRRMFCYPKPHITKWRGEWVVSGVGEPDKRRTEVLAANAFVNRINGIIPWSERRGQ